MKRIWFAFLIALLLTSCGGSVATSVVTPTTPPVSNETAYPAPENIDQTGYPVPSVEVIYEPTWTPAPNTGMVTGVLKLNGEPVKNTTLFLGTFLKNAEGQDFTAVVEPAVSPQTSTFPDGSFSFVNVAPGRYSLILSNAVSQYLLFKPGTQEHYVIEVSENETFDVGVIDYDELPLP